MKIEQLSIEEGILKGEKLPFVFLRSLSSMYLGRKLESIDLSEVIEARFFGENTEIRMQKKGKDLCAVGIYGEKEDEIMVNTYAIQNNLYGNQIDVACHLDFDEDGQVFIQTRRLINWR